MNHINRPSDSGNDIVFGTLSKFINRTLKIGDSTIVRNILKAKTN